LPRHFWCRSYMHYVLVDAQGLFPLFPRSYPNPVMVSGEMLASSNSGSMQSSPVKSILAHCEIKEHLLRYSMNHNSPNRIITIIVIIIIHVSYHERHGWPRISKCSMLVFSKSKEGSTSAWIRLHFTMYKYFFYRAMHFSAKRGIKIACRLPVCPSVCLSVTLVDQDHIT